MHYYLQCIICRYIFGDFGTIMTLLVLVFAMSEMTDHLIIL